MHALATVRTLAKTPEICMTREKGSSEGPAFKMTKVTAKLDSK